MTRTFTFAGASALVLSLGISVLPGFAATGLPSHPCTPGLKRVISEWEAAAFEPPTKPAQALVYGRGGRSITGAQYHYVVAQIEQATQDCLSGNVPAVRAHVAAAEAMFNYQG